MAPQWEGGGFEACSGVDDDDCAATANFAATALTAAATRWAAAR